ncbi:MAG: hypothetical protein ABID09_03200 [Candidatus Omnitrophota bacterium]
MKAEIKWLVALVTSVVILIFLGFGQSFLNGALRLIVTTVLVWGAVLVSSEMTKEKQG